MLALNSRMVVLVLFRVSNKCRLDLNLKGGSDMFAVERERSRSSSQGRCDETRRQKERARSALDMC